MYTLSSGEIYSPLYPRNYPNNTMCTYNITVQRGEMLQVIDSSSLYNGDSVELFERDPSSGRLIQKRFQYFNGYYPLSHSVLLRFQSNNAVTYFGRIFNYRATKGLFYHRLLLLLSCILKYAPMLIAVSISLFRYLAVSISLSLICLRPQVSSSNDFVRSRML